MTDANTYHAQTARFLAAVATCMPQLSAEVMQGWIENPMALKKFLRSLCPSEGTALRLVNDSVQLDAVAVHNPQKFFQTRTGLNVTQEFQWRVLSRAVRIIEDVGCDAQVLRFYDLTKSAGDYDIISGLGEPHLFDAYELCACIAQMINRQPYGEEGDLLSGDAGNLFYVTGSVVVSVRWSSSYRPGWDINADTLSSYPRRVGSRVFAFTDFGL